MGGKENKKRRKTEQKKPVLIEYIDFTDYVRLICKTDNWKDVSSVVFGTAGKRSRDVSTALPHPAGIPPMAV